MILDQIEIIKDKFKQLEKLVGCLCNYDPEYYDQTDNSYELHNDPYGDCDKLISSISDLWENEICFRDSSTGNYNDFGNPTSMAITFLAFKNDCLSTYFKDWKYPFDKEITRQEIPAFEEHLDYPDTFRYIHARRYMANCFDLLQIFQKQMIDTNEEYRKLTGINIPEIQTGNGIDTYSSTESSKQNFSSRLLVFNAPETIDLIYNELSYYFEGRCDDFKRTLQGENMSDLLIFPHNQNKFVEVFRRLRYNRFLSSSSTEIRDWICLNFKYRFTKGSTCVTKNFNGESVYDVLSKGKGEPSKYNRICNVSWLPYKTQKSIQNDKILEKNK